MAYPWAVKVRPDWDMTTLGYSYLNGTKNVCQLPAYFGGGYANGAAITAIGIASRTATTWHQGGSAAFIHKRAAFQNLTDGWLEVPETRLPSHSNGYGGLTFPRTLLVPQRNGRYAYVVCDEGESGNSTSCLHVFRMAGPGDVEAHTLVKTTEYYYGSANWQLWHLGDINSGFVTDHDRAPAMWLQTNRATMMLRDEPEWWAKFGYTNRFGGFAGAEPPIRQGYGWAFHQSHAAVSNTFAPTLCPPVNRYRAPDLLHFQRTNIKTVATGSYNGITFFDLEVYRAKWKAGQWVPGDDQWYAEDAAQSQSQRVPGGPPFLLYTTPPGRVEYIRDRINPNRMGFDTDWKKPENLLGTIRGLQYSYSTISSQTAVQAIYADRDEGGNIVLMLHNIVPRIVASGVAGAVYRSGENGFRLSGVVPGTPELNGVDGGGLYAENQTTTGARLLWGTPTYVANQHLTTPGQLTGVGVAESRGKIWKRGELNRESWLV